MRFVFPAPSRGAWALLWLAAITYSPCVEDDAAPYYLPRRTQRDAEADRGKLDAGDRTNTTSKNGGTGGAESTSAGNGGSGSHSNAGSDSNAGAGGVRSSAGMGGSEAGAGGSEAGAGGSA